MTDREEKSGRFRALWERLTSPQKTDTDEARREYMTNVLCLLLGMMSILLCLVFGPGWLLGWFPPDSFGICLVMAILFIGGWAISRRGGFRVSAFILLGYIFFIAAYGNYIGGPGAPATAIYVLAIIVSAMLIGQKVLWMTTGLSIACYIALYWGHIAGLFQAPRAAADTFANRVIIVAGIYIATAALIVFVIRRFLKAVNDTKSYASALESQTRKLYGLNRELEVEIAERRKAEDEKEKLTAQFLQSQKMEAVGRLAGGIAHDFNNSMTAVLGYCELLLGRLASDDPSRPDIQGIKTRVLRSSSLTRQLLAFSRKQIIQPVPVRINEVLDDMRELLDHLIGEDLDLKLSLASDLWLVRADPTQMEQVILNLVVNARDAMPDGGSLLIETRNAELDHFYAREHLDVQPGEYALLVLTDTGIGMDQATKARLFEPFFTTKETGKGTGLGLATVYGIVKQNGGHIQVASTRGKGTSFSIYLPRISEAPAVSSKFAESASSSKASTKPAEASVEPAGLPVMDRQAGKGRTVLVVEDEDSIRDLIRRVLEHHSYQVLEAADAAGARIVEAGYKGDIDLLVTDVVISGDTNGKDLAAELSVRRPGLRVLYMSGYPETVISRDGILEEGVHFIQKPFPLEDFLQVLKDLIDTPV